MDCAAFVQRCDFWFLVQRDNSPKSQKRLCYCSAWKHYFHLSPHICRKTVFLWHLAHWGLTQPMRWLFPPKQLCLLKMFTIYILFCSLYSSRMTIKTNSSVVLTSAKQVTKLMSLSMYRKKFQDGLRLHLLIYGMKNFDLSTVSYLSNRRSIKLFMTSTGLDRRDEVEFMIRQFNRPNLHLHVSSCSSLCSLKRFSYFWKIHSGWEICTF